MFKKIKLKNPYVPIIFHTGTTARQEERRDLRRQFRPHAYVQKGDPEQLMDTVVSAVESYGNILRNVKLSESLYEELKKSSDKIKTNIEWDHPCHGNDSRDEGPLHRRSPATGC